MTLSAEVINLIGLCLLDNSSQVRTITQITIVQNKVFILDMRILINMINTLSVKRRRSSFNTMNLIAFSQ